MSTSRRALSSPPIHGSTDGMVIDLLQFMFNLILGMFLIRFTQMKMQPGDASNALAFLFH